MGIENISTGYKPEFALGALYHGFNAANADEASQLELIKNYLANQKAQMELPTAALEGSRSLLMGTPENVTAYAQGQLGTFADQAAKGKLASSTVDKNIAATNAGYDQKVDDRAIAKLMQPFKVNAAPYEGQALFDKTRGNAAVMGNQAGILTGMDELGQAYTPNVLANMNKDYQRQVGVQGYTPEHWSKMAVEDIKGRWDVTKANIMAKAQTEAAKSGGKAAWAMALPHATSMITKTQQELADLENNPLSEHITHTLATRGLKQGTKEYNEAYKSQKDALRVELRKQLADGQKFLDEIRRASGLMGEGVATPKGAPKVGDDAQIRAAVEASGIPYEPNIYEYRVVNGETQRKKKDK